MAEPTAVFVIVVHITISIFGVSIHSRVLPDNPKLRGAFAIEAKCLAIAPTAQKEFERYRALVDEFRIGCEKMELRK